MVRLHQVVFAPRHGEGTVPILHGIDLGIEAGEIVGLVGPSGSGKSSLLAIIAGVERPTGGSVTINGVALERLGADELARLRRSTIGVVFQDFHLIPAMTALENVALPLELAGEREALGRAREMLAAVGLEHRLDHRPGELSGGEQQRVAIARAFVHRPPLVLADEPTGNLDQDTSRQVMTLLFRMAEQLGTTMLLVTHDPELAARTHRILRLRDGRLVE